MAKTTGSSPVARSICQRQILHRRGRVVKLEDPRTRAKLGAGQARREYRRADVAKWQTRSVQNAVLQKGV